MMQLRYYANKIFQSLSFRARKQRLNAGLVGATINVIYCRYDDKKSDNLPVLSSIVAQQF
jgi:hypothetical protein